MASGMKPTLSSLCEKQQARLIQYPGDESAARTKSKEKFLKET